MLAKALARILSQGSLAAGSPAAGACTSTLERDSMTSSLCGRSMMTVRVFSPKGPVPATELEGLGVTLIAIFSTVCVADDCGVRRSTQRAKVTGSS